MAHPSSDSSRAETVVEIGTDASPWGLGGWLSVNGVITQYFASPLTKEDSDKFGLPLADACGQQVWEALAILVAIVLWFRSSYGHRAGRRRTCAWPVVLQSFEHL